MNIKTDSKPCCQPAIDLIVKLAGNKPVPAEKIWEYLDAVRTAGAPLTETSFFVALIAGHQIKDHGASVEDAMAYALRTGLPNSEGKLKVATAADVVEKCELLMTVIEVLSQGGELPQDMTTEFRKMAVETKIPDGYGLADVLIILHDVKGHGIELAKAIEDVRQDPRATYIRHNVN